MESLRATCASALEMCGGGSSCRFFPARVCGCPEGCRGQPSHVTGGSCHAGTKNSYRTSGCGCAGDARLHALDGLCRGGACTRVRSCLLDAYGVYAFYLRSEKNALYIRKVVAQYDNLPVYKAAYDLLQSIYRDMGNVPRDVKFTLVETLKNELTEILVLIYKANSTTEKLPLIMDMRERLVGVKVRLRLLHDLRHVGTKLYAHLVEQVEAVSKQLASWQKYVKDIRPNPKAEVPSSAVRMTGSFQKCVWRTGYGAGDFRMRAAGTHCLKQIQGRSSVKSRLSEECLVNSVTYRRRKMPAADHSAVALCCRRL